MLYFLFYSIKKKKKKKKKQKVPLNALMMHVERQVNVNIFEE
jgi:hypothetical protein